MRANFLVVLAAVMIVFVSASAGVFAEDLHEKSINSQDTHGKKYIVDKFGENDLNNLRAEGCEILKHHKKVASVECPDSVAATHNLMEDIKVYALDINSDTQIGAPSAWAQGFTGAGRKVAVIDTGMDYNHPQLSDSYAGGWNEIANSSNPFDDNGHGTHVSGIITANGGAVKGVAPGAQVLAFKVLDSTGSGSFSDVIAAMYDAVDGQDGVYGTPDDYNPDAISMSLGTGAPYLYTSSNCDSAYTAMRDAVAYANSRGVAVVAAAGNDARGVSIPGCISGVITVAAVDSGDARASFSGIGGSVDIAAPGVGINSTTPGNTYASWSGTSMATPHVSALVALLRQAKPNASVSEITSAIYNTAKDLGTAGWDKYYGYGRINASAAIAYVLPPVPVEPVHDVAVSSISSPSSAVHGTVVMISAVVTNLGNVPETLNVTAADITTFSVIGWRAVTLDPGTSQNISYSWNTSASVIGNHTISVNSGVLDGEANTVDNVKSIVVAIVAPPVLPAMHISSISIIKQTSGYKTRAVVTMTVVNATGSAVGSANVKGVWSGLTSGTSTATTSSSGKATFYSAWKTRANGAFKFAVSNITKSGWIYDTSANNATSVSLNVP